MIRGFRRLSAYRQSERGATLMETVAAVGIMVMALTMVGLPLASALQQDEEWRADLIATGTLSRASGWVSRDAFAGETISLADGSGPVDSLRLDWFDTLGAPHTATYTVDGSNLTRTYDGAGLIIARAVNSAGFTRAGELLTFTLDVDGATGTTDSITSYFLLRGIQ